VIDPPEAMVGVLMVIKPPFKGNVAVTVLLYAVKTAANKMLR
jgi:hypothetical protein